MANKLKSLEGVSKSLKNHIIKEMPTANAIRYEVDTMSEAPKWFRKFEEKNDLRWEKQEKFNAKQQEFNAKQQEFNKSISKFVGYKPEK